jgi:hypothetical protein
LSGVSLRSVKRIAEESSVVHVEDAAERAKTTDRPAQHGRELREPILEILQQTPDLASLEILRRVRKAGYEGGKTIPTTRWSPRSARSRPSPQVRFEGLPAEFSQQ